MVRLADELQAAPARNGSSTRATLCGGAGEERGERRIPEGCRGLQEVSLPSMPSCGAQTPHFIISELLVGILTRDRSRVF